VHGAPPTLASPARGAARTLASLSCARCHRLWLVFERSTFALAHLERQTVDARRDQTRNECCDQIDLSASWIYQRGLTPGHRKGSRHKSEEKVQRQRNPSAASKPTSLSLGELRSQFLVPPIAATCLLSNTEFVRASAERFAIDKTDHSAVDLHERPEEGACLITGYGSSTRPLR
jgi:hypothetical protein